MLEYELGDDFMSFAIVFFLPSVFGLKIFMNSNKEEKWFNLLIYYLLLVLFSNFIELYILSYSNLGDLNLVDYIQNSYIISAKYIFVNLLLNLFLSIIFTIIKKYFMFSIEVVHEPKKKNKNK